MCGLRSVVFVGIGIGIGIEIEIASGTHSWTFWAAQLENMKPDFCPPILKFSRPVFGPRCGVLWHVSQHPDVPGRQLILHAEMRSWL